MKKKERRETKKRTIGKYRKKGESEEGDARAVPAIAAPSGVWTEKARLARVDPVGVLEG